MQKQFLISCAILAVSGVSVLAQESTNTSTNSQPPAQPAGEQQKTQTFEELILSPGIWDYGMQDYGKTLKESDFRWVSQDKSEVNSTSKNLRFRDQYVYEAIVRFKEGKISEIILSLFNRGDAGDLKEDEFEKKFDSYTKIIDEISGVKGVDVSKGEGTVNRRMKTIVWIAEPTAFRLEYAISRVDNKKRAEFVNLILLKGDKNLTPEQMAGARKISLDPQSLKERVKTNDAGDFWIEVPMVVQGDKGYCSVSTMERVMRYYGLDINEHQMAQIADTETGGGTKPDALFKGIRSFGKTIGIKPDSLMDSDSSDYFKIIDAYNKMAKKMKKQEVTLHPGMNSVAGLYARMDKEAFLASRQRSETLVKKFLTTISGKIKLGVPVVWSVIFGMVEETPKGAQGVGGHTRLIIGFNEKTSEILYTDSWGRGHELKRMKAADAFAITTDMFSAEPFGTGN